MAQDVLGAGGQRSVAFRCRGHANVRASHLKSLEFTRADEITPRATCVLGVAADFDPALLRGLRGSLRVTIEAGGRGDVVRALANPGFGAGDRIVIRTTRHRSPETLATEADRGASRIDRDLVAALAGGGPVRVTISEEPAPLIGREATGLEGLAVAVEAVVAAAGDASPLLLAAGAPGQPEAAADLAGLRPALEAGATLLWRLDAERLDGALAAVQAAAGDRPVQVSLDLPGGARLLAGNASGVRAGLAGVALAGVTALLVAPGGAGAGGPAGPDALDPLVRALLEAGVSSRTVAGALAALPGRSYRRSYERVLRLKSGPGAG